MWLLGGETNQDRPDAKSKTPTPRRDRDGDRDNSGRSGKGRRTYPLQSQSCVTARLFSACLEAPTTTTTTTTTAALVAEQSLTPTS